MDKQFPEVLPCRGKNQKKKGGGGGGGGGNYLTISLIEMRAASRHLNSPAYEKKVNITKNTLTS